MKQMEEEEKTLKNVHFRRPLECRLFSNWVTSEWLIGPCMAPRSTHSEFLNSTRLFLSCRRLMVDKYIAFLLYVREHGTSPPFKDQGSPVAFTLYLKS